MDKIYYDEYSDNLYILVYIIGSGASADVWFAIEFKFFVKNIKNKKMDIDCKALKIFFENNTSEYRREKKLNNILKLDGVYCEYINYPVSNFTCNDGDIIVYDVMYDLYKLCKLYTFNFDDKFKNKIIDQMKDSINFVHLCGYIHTDIKIDNFLLEALDYKQNEILKYVKQYSFKKILNKNFNKNNFTKIFDIIKNDLVEFINNLYKKFNVKNDNNSDKDRNYKDDEDIEDDEEYINNQDNNSEISDDNKTKNSADSDYQSSYKTSNSSFNSNYNEFEKKYDKFHLNKLFEYGNEDNSEDNNEEEIQNNDNNKKFLNKYLINPKLKLTDFGLIKKNEVSETTNARNYRCPKIILGYKCDKELDYWSLDLTIYELINGKMLYSYHKTKEHEYYNNDLISLKLILEKSNKKEYTEYLELIKKSNRCNYILSSDDSLLFYKNLL